jgi:hypothetical protein
MTTRSRMSIGGQLDLIRAMTGAVGQLGQRGALKRSVRSAMLALPHAIVPSGCQTGCCEKVLG